MVDNQDFYLSGGCGKAKEEESKGSSERRINERCDVGDEGAVLPSWLLSFSHPSQKYTNLDPLSTSFCRHFEGGV